MTDGAVPSSSRVIKKRRDFLAAAKGRRWTMPGVVVQACERSTDIADNAARVGFTCSRKVGNAVTRNRAKRRLRAAADAVIRKIGREGWDYVLIGRQGSTIARTFSDLVADVTTSIERIHSDPRAAKGRKR